MTSHIFSINMVKESALSTKYLLFAGLFMCLSFLSSAQTVSIGAPVDGFEGVSDASFTVFIEGGGVNTTGSAINGLIDYSGTSSYGTHFTGAVSFSIPNGVDSVLIPINIIDNVHQELDKSLIASISNLSTGTIGSSSSTAMIFDDDLAPLQISIGKPVNKIESNGYLTFEVFFEGGGGNLTGVPITGDITYSGTAINGVDYNGPTTFSIGWNASSSNVSILVIDDAILESPETITATISNLSVGSIATASSTTTLFDDDSNSIYTSIGLADPGTEGSDDVQFIVFLEGGAVNTTGAPITGDINYSGVAINGVDFNGPASFSIPDGVSSDTIDVVVIDDALFEPYESVFATIANVNTGYILTPTRDTWIFDDESPSVVLFMGSPVDAVEGTSDISFDIFIEGGSINNTGAPITGTFDYYLASTALYGADFAAVNEFAIPVGASSTTVTIPVFDDHLLEPTETVIAYISSANVGATNSLTTAQIIDDDSGQYSISISSLTDGFENGADVSMIISFPNGVVNTTGAPITGEISYSGTANPPIDFSNIPYTFSIPDGANSVPITIPVVNDILVECDEFIVPTIYNQNIGSINIDTDTAYVFDDECAAVVSIHSVSDGGESGADVTFIISLDGGSTNGTGNYIAGTLDLSGGTAIPGVDFVDQQNFQIGLGVNSTTITVPIIDELEIESTETIVATISDLNFGTIGTSTATANVYDNDSISGIHSIEGLDLKIYPNPIESNLNLRSENQVKSCSITDVNGREVFAREVDAKEFELDVTFLNAGTYLVHILCENGDVLTKKFVKM